MDLEKKRADRAAFMDMLYDETNGSPDAIVGGERLAQQIGLDTSQARSLIQYLEGERLIEPLWSLGPQLPEVSITHAGIVEVERWHEHPNDPTQHFAPMVNVTHVHGDIINSNVITGSPGTTASVAVTPDEIADLLAALNTVRGEVTKSGISTETEQQILAEVEAVASLARAPKPNRDLLRQLARSLRVTTEGAAGLIAGTAALDSVHWLLS